MNNTVTVKLARGTYNCPETGLENDSALLLSRADEPGVVYPFPDTEHCAELVVDVISKGGLSVFDLLRSTEDFEESPEFTPYTFEVYVPSTYSDEVH